MVSNDIDEKYEANDAPQPDDAGNPHSDEKARILIHQESQGNADDQAGQSPNSKWYVDIPE